MGLSQIALAGEAGVGTMTIARIESGSHTGVSLLTIQKVLNVLGCSLMLDRLAEAANGFA